MALVGFGVATAAGVDRGVGAGGSSALGRRRVCRGRVARDDRRAQHDERGEQATARRSGTGHGAHRTSRRSTGARTDAHACGAWRTGRTRDARYWPDGRRDARRRSGRRARAPARDRGAAPGPAAADRSRRPRVVPARRDRVPRGRAPARRRAARPPRPRSSSSSGCVASTTSRSCPAAPGPGLSGGAAGIEGALTIAFTRMDPDPRDRPRQPHRHDPARASSTPTLKAAVAAEGLFYAPGPGLVRDVHDRRQPRHQRRRAVLREVRRDPRRGARARGRDGRRDASSGSAARTSRTSPGYGLIPLLVGSQGTLGLITEATLRLRPAPPPRATMLAFFPIARVGRRGRRRAHRRGPAARSRWS